MNFLTKLTNVINTGQSRSVILSGDIHDLFFDGTNYVPLIDLLISRYKVKSTDCQKGITQIVFRNNNPITVIGTENMIELDAIWKKYHGEDEKTLSERFVESNQNSVYAFELLRQITECTRLSEKDMKNNVLIIIESADLHIPDCEISRLSAQDRRKLAILQDWFGNPDFLKSHDSVILLSEFRCDIHRRIVKMPQVLSIEVALPTTDQRRDFIKWSKAEGLQEDKTINTLAEQTSGLSLHALRQLVLSGDYSLTSIAVKVEEYIVAQLGEGVVEFKRPSHTFDKVIGFRRIKNFMQKWLIPAFLATDDTAISGAAIAGPIGGGKTYICEAVAAVIGIPVIVLKNIRSKWYGETDQIFEKLRQILESFHKIMIFVDEADAMFGDINSDQDTERRLTGKIQAMMSDPRLKGKVIWLLMTARVHRLSADIRRPGRMDLIIPILDPDPNDEDTTDFIKWALGTDLASHAAANVPNYSNIDKLRPIVRNWSPASFASLRSRIKQENCQDIDQVIEVAQDIISPNIEDVRRYQTLQAKLNCTRRVLLVEKNVSADSFAKMRNEWKAAILDLENQGIS